MIKNKSRMKKGIGVANIVRRKLNMMIFVTVNNGCAKNAKSCMNLQ